MPVVDRVVVLQTRIGALPGRLRDLAEQLTRVDVFDDLAVLALAEAELGALFHGAHELTGYPHRVVRVLVLHRSDVRTAKIHIEAGIAQGANLVFFLGLGLDELFDVGVIHVQHDHLRGSTGSTAGLDGAGGGVGAAHERHGAGRRAAGAQQFLRRANAGEVEPRAGAALEDEPLFLVPVEDRIHGVVHREDEASAHLLGGLGADVEPDRRVEAEVLVQQHVGELVLEDLGIGRGSEVAVGLPRLAIGQNDAIDELLQALFALGGAQRPAEVLRRDDRGGVDAPEIREIHPTLLEDVLTGLPVGLDDVAPFPRHLVVGVDTRGAEHAVQAEPIELGAVGFTRSGAGGLCH